MNDNYQPPQRLYDYQKSRVYRWEDKTLSCEQFDYFMIEFQVKMCCELFSVKPPTVSMSRKRKVTATYFSSQHEIALPGAEGSWAHNQAIIIHESSHAVHRQLGDHGSSHGARFMAIYLHLLNEFTDHTTEELEQSCWQWGIRVGRLSDVMPY